MRNGGACRNYWREKYLLVDGYIGRDILSTLEKSSNLFANLGDIHHPNNFSSSSPLVSYR
jgi:hypothetical protein